MSKLKVEQYKIGSEAAPQTKTDSRQNNYADLRINRAMVKVSFSGIRRKSDLAKPGATLACVD